MTTYSKHDRTISARSGERFSIALDANPTTGYEWHAAVHGDAVVMQEAKIVPGTTGIGAAATQRFDFLAGREGRAAIELTLSRAWEKAPIETVRCEVDVTG